MLLFCVHQISKDAYFSPQLVSVGGVALLGQPLGLQIGTTPSQKHVSTPPPKKTLEVHTKYSLQKYKMIYEQSIPPRTVYKFKN